MRPVHLRAWERLRHAYVLEVPQRATSTSIAPGHPLDLAAVFGRTAPAGRRDRPGHRRVPGGHGCGPTRRSTCSPSRSTCPESRAPSTGCTRPRSPTCGCSSPTPSTDLRHLLGPASVAGGLDLLPRSVAQGPTPQATARRSGVRRPGGRSAASGRGVAAGHRLGGLRDADALGARRPARAGERGDGRRRLGGALRRPPADPVRAARDRGGSHGPSTCATGADERPADRGPCARRRPPSARAEDQDLVRWRLDVRYDGTDFSGWATQRDRRTVQGELELWLGRVLSLPEPPRLVCAGRTDAGVHARGQVVHVDLTAGCPVRSGGGAPSAAPGPARRPRGDGDPARTDRLRRAIRRDLAALLLPDQ